MHGSIYANVQEPSSRVSSNIGKRYNWKKKKKNALDKFQIQVNQQSIAEKNIFISLIFKLRFLFFFYKSCDFSLCCFTLNVSHLEMNVANIMTTTWSQLFFFFSHYWAGIHVVLQTVEIDN